MKCPECNSQETKISKKEVVCLRCGFVIDEQIPTAEKIFGDYEDIDIVGGMPVKPINIGLGYIYSPNEREILER